MAAGRSGGEQEAVDEAEAGMRAAGELDTRETKAVSGTRVWRGGVAACPVAQSARERNSEAKERTRWGKNRRGRGADALLNWLP